MTGKCGTQPGKQPGEDTAKNEEGKVSQYTGSRGESPRDKKLS